MEIRRSPFPKSAGGRTRFLFFSSLLKPSSNKQITERKERTARLANTYLTKGKFQEANGKIQIQDDKIKEILQNFLKIANAEFAKEMAYLKALESKIDKNLFNIKIPNSLSTGQDWFDFITALNYITTEATDFLSTLERERDRIISNINLKKEEGHKAWEYDRGIDMKTEEYMKALDNFFFTIKEGTNSYATTILEYILANYSNNLLFFDSSFNLKLNEAEFLMLVRYAVSHIISSILKSGKKMIDVFGKNRKLENLFRFSDDEIRKMFDLKGLEAILTSERAKRILTRQALDKFGVVQKQANASIKKSATKIINESISDNQNTGSYSLQQATDFLQNALSAGNWLEIDHRLIKNNNARKGALAEFASGLIKIDSSQRLAIPAGSNVTKIDVGFLEFTTKVNNSELDRIYNFLYKPLNPESKKKNNKFVGMTYNEWDTYARQLNKVLGELTHNKQQLTELAGSFFITENNKWYPSLGSTSEEFGGGSIGPNLTEQLMKINDLAKTGGLSLGDLNWLRTAVINTHESALGSSLKNPLENYLSIVASALLFDDGQKIMAQVAIAPQNIISQTSINKIHLFRTQRGLYYPLSQIMYAIYNKMAEIYGELSSMYSVGGGAEVQINFNNFPADNSPYIGLNMEDWKNTGANAENATSLSLTFLGGFLDVLDEIKYFSI